MSVVVDAVVVLGGLLVGRAISRRLRARRARPAADRFVAAKETQSLTGAPWGSACQLGDVIVRRVERDEAWLAGALVCVEERPVAAIFVAPEAGGDRAVFVRDGALAWMMPIADDLLVGAREPPYALEHQRVHFERTRRLPVRVERVGSGVPRMGPHAVLAEYAGPGDERIVVLAAAEAVLAWRGVALSERDYDVLPGGYAES